MSRHTVDGPTLPAAIGCLVTGIALAGQAFDQYQGFGAGLLPGIQLDND
jgi:hypothetical protein